jgi:autotransporter translocation and assembly factor TamB
MVTLVIDGALDCSSGDKGLVVNGKLEIPTSRWYLPAFLRQFQTSTSPAVPMLVRATNRIDTIYTMKEREDSDTLRLDIGIPINGKLDVHIPRGTWVESPKLLAELSGDLVVRIIDSRPAVSGTIEIMRGWVQMYGVRLNFKEGKITLKEGGELVPDVNIQMEYVFRDENREKKSLIVDIRGNAKDPEIVFLLEGKEIKQEDALSYMLFGRSTSDINSNQLSDLNNSASQMMEQMTSSLISSKLSSTVGKSLGMDVIELRGTDNWSKASLTGGKYFSDQLFVSFEKGFGKYDANETIPEILTVEYEVVKFLFFQLISGTDDRSGLNVIVKLDSGTAK